MNHLTIPQVIVALLIIITTILYALYLRRKYQDSLIKAKENEEHLIRLCQEKFKELEVLCTIDKNSELYRDYQEIPKIKTKTPTKTKIKNSKLSILYYQLDKIVNKVEFIKRYC